MSLSLTAIRLRVSRLQAQLDFYHGLLGLQVLSQNASHATLAPQAGGFRLYLEADPQARPFGKPALGLYHWALLLPSRGALAAVVRHLAQAAYPFEGASDHGVSEAFYLSDPEGNGLELYADRPKELWPRQGAELSMYNRAVDLNALLALQPQASPLDPQTQFGHLHLHVASLDQAESFFANLGMQTTQANFPGARFMAANGYHHHVGLNTWARGVVAPAGSTGLLAYEISGVATATQSRVDPNGATVHLPSRTTTVG